MEVCEKCFAGTNVCQEAAVDSPSFRRKEKRAVHKVNQHLRASQDFIEEELKKQLADEDEKDFLQVSIRNKLLLSSMNGHCAHRTCNVKPGPLVRAYAEEIKEN